MYRRYNLFFSILLFSICTYAASGFVKGTVKYIRIHDPNTYGAWTPPKFWFALEGVESAGNCPVWHGSVLFYMDTKEAYSMVLGSYIANKEIAVSYNDTTIVNGYCIARYITVGEPPPLYP